VTQPAFREPDERKRLQNRALRAADSERDSRPKIGADFAAPRAYQDAPCGKGSPAMKRVYAALSGYIKKGAGTGVQIPR